MKAAKLCIFAVRSTLMNEIVQIMRPCGSKLCAVTIETEMSTTAIFIYSIFQNKDQTRAPINIIISAKLLVIPTWLFYCY